MTSDKQTTRRKFVIGALVGVPGAALLSSCGGRQTTDSGNPATGGNAGSGAAGGSGAAPERTERVPVAPVEARGRGHHWERRRNGKRWECGGERSERRAGSGGSAGAPDSGTCTLYPAQTEGPFYLDLDLVRTDVTEGSQAHH